MTSIISTKATIKIGDNEKTDKIVVHPTQNNVSGGQEDSAITKGLLKEEHKTETISSDDEIAAGISSSLPSSQASSPLTSVTPTSVDMIDSALMSALRDPRERLGLLNLEQTLVDFLEKQPQDPHIDVGGPYNSMVVSPTLGYIGQSPQEFMSGTISSSTGTTSINTNTINNNNPNNPNNNIGSNNTNNLNRPQTTFQRCILHRICDRFNMTRENSYATDPYGCYLIRVVKGPDSKLPSRLLSSVKESEYQLSSSSDISSSTVNNSSTSSKVSQSNQLLSNFEQMELISSPSNYAHSSGDGAITAAVNNVGITSGPPNNNKKKVRKMKIMKRSSSSVSNGSDTGSNNGGKSKNNSKSRDSLSEKEKRYAEARARIFQQEETVSGSNELNHTGHKNINATTSNNSIVCNGISSLAENGSGTMGVALSAKNGVYKNDTNASSLEGDTKEITSTFNSCNSNMNKNCNSFSTSGVQSSSLSLSSFGQNKTQLNKNKKSHSASSLTSMNSNGTGDDTTAESQQQQQQAARLKVTYRNRQQEETDPDFRRGAGMVVVQPTPYNPKVTAAGYSSTNGARSSGGGGLIGGVYYPNNPNNNSGYHYAQHNQNQYHQQYHHPQQQQQQQQHYGAQYYPAQSASTGSVTYLTGNGPSASSSRSQGQPRMYYQPYDRRQQEQHHPTMFPPTSASSTNSSGAVPAGGFHRRQP